jgi:hypothetical protein
MLKIIISTSATIEIVGSHAVTVEIMGDKAHISISPVMATTVEEPVAEPTVKPVDHAEDPECECLECENIRDIRRSWKEQLAAPDMNSVWACPRCESNNEPHLACCEVCDEPR